MVDATKIGNLSTDTMTGKAVRVLTRKFLAFTASNAYPMQYAGAAYQVTAGKTFYPTGMYISHDNGGWAAACITTLVYADDAALTTNVVQMGFQVPGFATIAAMEPFTFPVGSVNVPATKYFGFWCTAAANSGQLVGVIIVGYEA